MVCSLGEGGPRGDSLSGAGGYVHRCRGPVTALLRASVTPQLPCPFLLVGGRRLRRAIAVGISRVVQAHQGRGLSAPLGARVSTLGAGLKCSGVVRWTTCRFILQEP